MTAESRTIAPAGSQEAIECYAAFPEGPVRGGIIVIHELWGLQEQTRRVADQFASAGYVAFAPDVLTQAGIDPVTGAELERLRYEGTDEERVRAQPRMRDALSAARAPENTAWVVKALIATADALVAVPEVGSRIAVTGFCYGGSLAFELAAADPRVTVALPFYGRAPGRETLSRIDASVLAFYGQDDPPLIEDLPRLIADAEGVGLAFDHVVYPGAKHAFFNDLNPHSYDQGAAEDAYRRALELLERTLG